MKTFILGGIKLSFEAHIELNQSYDEDEASTITRHADGSARKQTAWDGKIKTVITGTGWIPPALFALNYRVAMELACIAPLAIIDPDASPLNTITLPAARRSDAGYEPWAAAVIAGRQTETPIIGIDSNHLATITPVAGAEYYQIFYYPKIQVFAKRPTYATDVLAEKTVWRLEAVEV